MTIEEKTQRHVPERKLAVTAIEIAIAFVERRKQFYSEMNYESMMFHLTKANELARKKCPN